jgi:hypothetical protein
MVFNATFKIFFQYSNFNLYETYGSSLLTAYNVILYLDFFLEYFESGVKHHNPNPFWNILRDDVGLYSCKTESWYRTIVVPCRLKNTFMLKYKQSRRIIATTCNIFACNSPYFWNDCRKSFPKFSLSFLV